jgi:hypothetical protein
MRGGIKASGSAVARVGQVPRLLLDGFGLATGALRLGRSIRVVGFTLVRPGPQGAMVFISGL